MTAGLREAAEAAVRAIPEDSPFAGVVRVERGDAVEFEAVRGLADRRHRIEMTPDTRLAMASGSKVFTALAVLSLVEEGVLGLDTPVRQLLGTDLPLVDDRVTVEHLLCHRSGIGDYLDEDDWQPSDYGLTVPVPELDRTEAFLPMLEGHPQVSAPGERFVYNNGGFMVLALVAERACGTGYHELVKSRVIAPAGLSGTDFLRSDALPAGTALGYVEVDGEWRTNVFHLPVLGNGDGGLYTTAADMHRFWLALFGGRIVSPATLTGMLQPRGESEDPPCRYGLGIWLHATDPRVMAEGCDSGVSFRSVHDPRDSSTCTLIATTANGIWKLAHAVDAGWG